MYVHDALQQYARSHQERHELTIKAKKIAQLTQKLYALSLLEETLQVKMKMLNGSQLPEDLVNAGRHQVIS